MSLGNSPLSDQPLSSLQDDEPDAYVVATLTADTLGAALVTGSTIRLEE